MQKRRSVDLRQQALAAVAGGMCRAQVCQVFGIHRTTLRRWQVRQQQGQLPDKLACGGPRKIAAPHQAALLAQLQANADATLAEHAARWHQEQGQQISPTTMGRAIARIGWTRKKRH